MYCVVEHTGKMKCKSYDSLLALPRGLIIISIIVCFFATTLGVTRSVQQCRKCNNFLKNRSIKIKMVIASSICFIIAGVLCLIPVCLTTSAIKDRYFPILTSLSTDLDLQSTLDMWSPQFCFSVVLEICSAVSVYRKRR